MAERLVRTQLLLERQQHHALREIARFEGRSLSELVREILREELEQRERSRQAQIKRSRDVWARIQAHKEAILARRGGDPIDVDVVELIHQMRDDRAAELLPCDRGDRD